MSTVWCVFEHLSGCNGETFIGVADTLDAAKEFVEKEVKDALPEWEWSNLSGGMWEFAEKNADKSKVDLWTNLYTSYIIEIIDVYSQTSEKGAI